MGYQNSALMFGPHVYTFPRLWCRVEERHEAEQREKGKRRKRKVEEDERNEQNQTMFSIITL